MGPSSTAAPSSIAALKTGQVGAAGLDVYEEEEGLFFRDLSNQVLQDDVLARLLYGFRISVLFGLALTITSSVIGVLVGAVSGYFGGWTDLLTQRFIEIWTSIPSLYLLLIISSVLVPGFWVLLGILLLFSWTALVAQGSSARSSTGERKAPPITGGSAEGSPATILSTS